MEQGRVFYEDDYVNALTLLYNSQSQTNPVRLDNNIKKLEQMFADDACQEDVHTETVRFLLVIIFSKYTCVELQLPFMTQPL